MTFKNKTTQKFISSLLIIFILAPVVLFAIPKKASAQLGGISPTCMTLSAEGMLVPCASETTSWFTKLKTFLIAVSTSTSAGANVNVSNIKTIELAKEVLRETLRTFARRLLQQMTQSTVNWINSGFHGSPLFLERPGSFFKDIAKYEIKNLVSIIGYDSNRFPYGKSSAIGTIEGYKQTFEQHAQYSLSKVINDPALLNNYRNDFGVGGLEGFRINTQYPQNNYIGFQMLYANELARRLAGTTTNNAGMVQAGLSQGGGFLSPQMCETNENYNNLKNQFMQPTFKPKKPEPPNALDFCASKFPAYDGSVGLGYSAQFTQCLAENNAAYAQWRVNTKAEYDTWAETNLCLRPDGTSGLVNTTPGSVVGAQIMKAITGPYDQTSLAAAMGNSLSAIFDALLNKFMSSGLNALGGNKNQADTSDDFDYNGHTLGGPGDKDIWGGPEEEVILGDFKKNVQNAIVNANLELRLIDNDEVSRGGPGILQMFAQIWPKVQELDMCLPGPNIGWQDRMEEEVQKNGESLQVKMNDGNLEKKNAATEAYDHLQSAAASFKDWVSNKINFELPGSKNYLSAVNSIKSIYAQADELSARKNAILEALIKLESIETDLGVMTTQPESGSLQEKTLIRLKQRLDGMIVSISTTASTSEMQNLLDDAKDKLASLDKMVPKCNAERTSKGWDVPGGEDSTFKDSKTEQELFCSMPIEGGYSHGPFKNTEGVTYPEIPLLNAENVYPDASGVQDSQHIDIAISCDVIGKTSAIDYKKNLPGTIFPIR